MDLFLQIMIPRGHLQGEKNGLTVSADVWTYTGPSFYAKNFRLSFHFVNLARVWAGK
jgi:hypothetical protein